MTRSTWRSRAAQPSHAATAGPALPDDGEAGPDDDEEGEPSGASGGEGEGEGGDDQEAHEGESFAERHLYRAALDGAFTTAPARVVPEYRGPAAFLPRAR